MNIILSIHPKWAKLIYEGKKTIEWRKSYPKEFTNETKVFLYETAPVCKVTGFFTLDCVLFKVSAFKEGDILESKIERGCVDIEALKKYQGKSPYLYGLEVFMPRKYSTPKTLAEFGLNRPPQSWCYTEVCVK